MNGETQKISLNQDTDFIKLIASLSMLCDHVGKIFFPEIIVLQIIGRISFPIFAYCIVVGSLYTSDIKRYMLRLGLFALVSQFFYIQAFAPGATNPLTYIRYKNIIFTLLIGLIAIHSWKEKKWIVFVFCIVSAIFGKIDYGIYAIILMLSFYWFRNNNLLSFVIVSSQFAFQFIRMSNPIDVLGVSVGINGFQMLSLPFIYIKTSVNPKISKYFFYIFYPAHLFVLFMIQVFN